MKKKLVLGMAGVMAFTTLLGTNVVIGNADEDKVEITYTSRGNADEIKVYQQAVDAFNEAQDKIHVTFEASPSDGYSQQLITQLAGGTAADVIFVEDTVMKPSLI
jgi:ABC-type glycerol-3-phosphate transport system substrate-binding protein